MTQARLTRGPIGAALARMAAPMVIGLAAVSIFGLVDAWFIARLGRDELAALGFALPVMQLIGSVAFGLGTGATSVIARALGEGDLARVRRLTTDAVLLSVGIVVVLAAVGLALLEEIFGALGATGMVLEHIEAYMYVWLPGMIFLVAPMVGNAAIRATGDTRSPALVMIVGGVLNAALDPLLIFGVGPFEGLGVQGAALASALSRAVTLVVSLWILHRRLGMLDLQRPSAARIKRSGAAILAVGAPAALANAAVPLGLALLTQQLARFGDAAVAAMGAGIQVEMLALLPSMALGAGLAPFIGQNWGAGEIERTRRALRIAVRFTILWGLSAWLGLMSLRGLIAGAFVEDPRTAAALGAWFVWGSLGLSLLGALRAVTGALNAIGRARDAAGLNLIRLPLLVGLPAALGALFGLEGAFFGVALANITTGGLALILAQIRLYGAPRPPAPLALSVRGAASP